MLRLRLVAEGVENNRDADEIGPSHALGCARQNDEMIRRLDEIKTEIAAALRK
jgi:hypothetical protein